MIWPDTFLTFVDLNRGETPLEEFTKIIRTKRGRMAGVIRLELIDEGRPKPVYGVIVQSETSNANISGNTSMVVYYMELDSIAAGGHDPAGDVLNRNQVRLFEALPDPTKAESGWGQSTGPPKSTLDKNQFHGYLEQKIKEIGQSFRI